MRIGVDLGGTKIEAIALDRGGEVRARRRVPTPAADGYEAIVRAVAELVLAVERETAEACTVGVGTPGAIAPGTGRIKNSNTTCLIGRPLDVDLRRALGREVRLANDADCFALSEATDGAGAGAEIVFGVILGTGVGGGIVHRGALLRGPNAVAGEWGHNPLPWATVAERPGPACYCGKRGCIETFLSGPALARDHGDGVGGPEIVARAAHGDLVAEAALARYEDRLARALAHVIDLVDPHVIVLGGGLSAIERIYPAVLALLPRWVFGGAVATRLVPPEHGDASGVRGAAWLW